MVRMAGLVLAALTATVAPAVQDSMNVEVADGLVSVDADRVALGTLLNELDRTVGSTSTVPVGLRGQLVSVRFSDVPLNDAIRRVFAGLAIDYAVVGGDRIVVLAASQAATERPVNRSATPEVAPPVAQPVGGGAFQLPSSLQAVPTPVDRPAPLRGRDGQGFEQLLQVDPAGMISNQTQPGLGTVLPFGVIPDAPNGPRVDQPTPGFLGNTAPAILDLNQQPTPPAGPGDPPAREQPNP